MESNFMTDSAGKTLPGIEKYNDKLLRKLSEMKKARGSAYKPRTSHKLHGGAPMYTNRLFLETSPYLVQHAHNPVNWYAWGDEAFEKAVRLDCPVLLSVGYSTCHWCHVMEEESFENEEIARYLNENYIAIKVDREERPDIDAVYMNAVQLLTGSGGWPMNVWLFPDGRPFFGGTYFPPEDGDRGALIGFRTLLEKLKNAYANDRTRIETISAKLTEAVRDQMVPATGKGIPSPECMEKAARFYRERFDPINGGLSGAPKFPSSLPARFLLRHHRRTGDKTFLDMAVLSLKKMAGGGMYDQAGGGFHRYSVDEQWLVPHFEKMLYDNALFVLDYLEAWQATGDEDFKKTATEILRYVARDMTSPEGAFYSATDADSLNPSGHREEGRFFTWTPDELEEALGSEKAEIVGKYYAVTASGNFEGRNILNAPKSFPDVSAELGIPENELRSIVAESNELLRKTREKRPAPLRDEKIIVSWNGLMISAFARAGLALGDSEYVERAENATRFIIENISRDGRLFRSCKDGAARHSAFLQDYSFFIAALLDLYEVSGDVKWMKHAVRLDTVLEEYYEDIENGGFFITGSDNSKLLAREKPSHDGAVPSGNSVAVLNLLRLHKFTTIETYRIRAEKALSSFSVILSASPFSLSEMLQALDFLYGKPKEIVIVIPDEKNCSAEPFLNVLGKRFFPNRVLTVTSEGKQLGEQAELVPCVRGKSAMGGKTTVHVCESGVCGLPTNDPKVFANMLAERKTL